MSELSVMAPYVLPRHAPTAAVSNRLRADTSRTDLVDLAVRGKVDLYALESADYPLLLAAVSRQIIETATPWRADRLFPSALAVVPGDGGCQGGGACFGHGAAGVLWTLASAGATVPDELTDWLVRAADGMTETAGPGFLDGLAGIALTLDRLGRFDAADRLWRRVEEYPLELLGTSLADGLAGVGLALLERAPVRDVATLMARVEDVGARILEKLDASSPGKRPGLLDGGTGAALFLLHLYALNEDPALLDGVEKALRQDIVALGWGPDGRRRRETPEEASIWHGSDGVTMVLHEAVQHVREPWLVQSYRSAAQVCSDRLERLPSTFEARAGTLLAVQYLSCGPWTPDAQRHAAVRLHLGRLDLRPSAGYLRLTDATTTSRERPTGTAGFLLALGSLLGTGESRLPFFW